MEYRIKTTEYNDGTIIYYPEKKVFLFWVGLASCGDIDTESNGFKTKEEATKAIDLNFADYVKKDGKKIEYITK